MAPPFSNPPSGCTPRSQVGEDPRGISYLKELSQHLASDCKFPIVDAISVDQMPANLEAFLQRSSQVRSPTRTLGRGQRDWDGGRVRSQRGLPRRSPPVSAAAHLRSGQCSRPHLHDARPQELRVPLHSTTWQPDSIDVM